MIQDQLTLEQIQEHVRSWASTMIQQGVCSNDDIEGCSDSEIVELIRMQGGVQPTQAYRFFLQLMGRKCGTLWTGTDMLFPDGRQVRRAARKVMRSGRLRRHLDETAYVLQSHQGYDFTWQKPSGGLDAPVWRYVEGHEEPELVAPSFIVFGERELQRCIRFHQDRTRQ